MGLSSFSHYSPNRISSCARVYICARDRTLRASERNVFSAAHRCRYKLMFEGKNRIAEMRPSNSSGKRVSHSFVHSASVTVPLILTDVLLMYSLMEFERREACALIYNCEPTSGKVQSIAPWKPRNLHTFITQLNQL